jgi:hypothetical protein
MLGECRPAEVQILSMREGGPEVSAQSFKEVSCLSNSGATVTACAKHSYSVV